MGLRRTEGLDIMCGIAGALDLEEKRLFPSQILAAMTRAIAHRGPDDEAWHREPGLALGSRRLSIVDLQGGRQPMTNEDNSVWVAYNGELFEYPELRQELMARGHHLSSRCDTELWVHLYEDHGTQMFDRARGQFAVSLWDRNERTLVLGRDRAGICPLYYTEVDGWLLWASEIKALLASGLVPARPDPAGLDDFFNLFAAGPARTCFQGIRAIPPGHYLQVRDGQTQLHRYWDLDFPDAGQELRTDDPTPLVEELEQRLRRATARRLRGDVPVVSYLSGGLDSTVVLTLGSLERGQALPSFTIGLDRAGPDEREQAAESAAALGSPLTIVEMNRSAIAQAYPDLIRAAEMPVLDTSSACLLRLASTVHNQGYKVVLTGEGADEALAGYVWFRSQKVRNAIVNRVGLTPLKLLRRLWLRSIGGGLRRSNPQHPIRGVRTAQQDLYDLLGQSRSLLYSDGMWDNLGSYSAYESLSETVNDRFERWHPLNQSLYIGYKVLLSGMLLHAKGDRIAMNSSVETRYPFLDDEVIDFCASLAPEYKLNGLTNKWLLRQVAARAVPPRIANRPKTMFRADRALTFLGESRPHWVDQLLSPESLRATGYFDPKAMERERRLQNRLPRCTPRRLALDLGLTCAVSVQLWHHIYCGGQLCDLPSWTPPSMADDFSGEPIPSSQVVEVD